MKQRGFFTLFCSAFFDARAFTDRAKGREYAESSLTNATEQTTSIGGVYNSYCVRRFWCSWSESGKPEDGHWWDAVVSYAGDVYEVEWIDDPGVFHRADYQAVRAPGSPAAKRSRTWSPNARAAPAASYAMLGFSQPAAPEQAPPATGSGRAAAQEAARRIREQS